MSKEASLKTETLFLQQLEQAANLLGSARNPSLALERILKSVSATLAAYGSVIVLTDAAPKTLQGCGWGEFQVQIAQVARELRDGLDEQATATARHTALPGVSSTPAPEGMLLAAPIRAAQHVLGVIVLFCPGQASVWLRHALPFCNTIGTCLGLYLQSAGLQERLKSLPQSRMPSQVGRLASYDPDRMIGDSPPIMEVLQQVEQAASSRSTVLLRGESGTGKELVARALHKLSDRSQQAFIQLNCAALPESLLESELFGHERGAFTGAVKMRRGRFEMADKGTLFLDEIGDISPTTQVKLLRVLQERSFERVGGSRHITVDTRIIAATNVDLEAAVRTGRFREDLYYRLNVVPIVLPPLRQRQEDIPLLVGYFLQRFNAENHKNLKISSPAMDLIVGYDWPGNVRELENCIERMVVMARRDIVAPEEVPLPVNLHDMPTLSAPVTLSKADDQSLTRTIADLEHERLIEALQRTGGVQTRAASLLGITPRQLGYKLKKYQIDPKRLVI
ncbi:MAG: sigma 54-interacting transcriptional regulator [bacterium]|nr:sigma 54-interacting transcriptional regulator [bacterium]